MMDNFNKEEILNILIEILKSDDPTKNLTRLLSRTAEILEADAATIVIWTGNLGVFHSTVNIPPEIPLRGRILSPDRGGLDGRLFNNQERIWIQLSNYSKNMDALPVLKPANFYLAVGGIINIRQSELTATICFYYKERTKKFQEEELKYFPIILTQLGIAILNAHLQQEFLSISELNQETTNFLDILVNSNPDIIINLDVNGKIKLWNDVAEKVLKYSAHEIINKFLPLKKGENEEKFINFLSEARKGKFIQNQELIFVPKKDSMNHKLI
ncbi:MAG: PAS domain-containing protein, partial [Promethearchaeota archaeon]